MNFEIRNSKFFSHDFKEFIKKPAKKKPAPRLPENLKNLAGILMKEQFLTQLDDLITSEFLITAKPKSELSLLVSLQGKEILMSRSGRFLAMLHSGLPKDSNNEANTIIECYFINNQLVLHDLLRWDQQDFRDKPIETRVEFLLNQSKTLSSRSVQLTMQEYLYCEANNLHHCYSASKPFLQDGIFFYRKGKKYTPGFSPHKLLWKDSFCAILEDFSNQFFVLPNGYLATGDGFKVFKLRSESEVSKFACKTVKTQALEIENFSITSLTELQETHEEASSWSSVVFNWKLRNNQVNFEDFFNVLKKIDQMELETPDFFDFDSRFEYNDFEFAFKPTEERLKSENKQLIEQENQESSEIYAKDREFDCNLEDFN